MLRFVLPLAVAPLASAGCRMPNPAFEEAQGMGGSGEGSDEGEPASDSGASTTEPTPEGTGDDGGPGPRSTCAATGAEPLLCFDFELFEGDTLIDRTGHGRHADAHMLGLAEGPWGKAGALAPGTRLVVEHDDGLAPQRLTLELQVRATIVPGPGARMGLVDKQNQWGMFVTADGLMCRTNSHEVSSQAPLAPGAWTHLACVYDEQSVTVFVDGIAIASTEREGPLPHDQAPLVIGNDSPEPVPSMAFAGSIDHVRIWSRALGAQELCELAETCD